MTENEDSSNENKEEEKEKIIYSKEEVFRYLLKKIDEEKKESLDE